MVEFWDSWVDGAVLPGTAVSRDPRPYFSVCSGGQSLGAVLRYPCDWQPGIGDCTQTFTCLSWSSSASGFYTSDDLLSFCLEEDV